MLGLANRIQPYAWGPVDGLVPLVGTPPTGGHEAELWVGTHPAAPSTTDDGLFSDVITADPEGVLGADLVARFGPRLPFLLKVLAIEGPLSIQLHPDADQAAAGFAREEAAGIAIDAPERCYRDPFAKPELVVALTPTWVLVGFRTGQDAAARLRALGPVAADLAALVAGEPDARKALVHLLTAPDEEKAVLSAAAARVGAFAGARRWVRRLAAAWPGDPVALAPLILELRMLHPGEGVFLPAGVPHAYLQGAGVELMGASDNTVRGGLTTKYVDPAALVELLAAPGVGTVPLGGDAVALGIRRYAPAGVPEIALHRLEPGSRAMAVPQGPGPAVAMATGGPLGTAVLTTADDRVELGHGRAVVVAPEERASCRVRGPGVVWWATVGDI